MNCARLSPLCALLELGWRMETEQARRVLCALLAWPCLSRGGPVLPSVPRRAAVERIWHTYDSQGQILAWGFRKKS